MAKSLQCNLSSMTRLILLKLQWGSIDQKYKMSQATIPLRCLGDSYERHQALGTCPQNHTSLNSMIKLATLNLSLEERRRGMPVLRTIHTSLQYGSLLNSSRQVLHTSLFANKVDTYEQDQSGHILNKSNRSAGRLQRGQVVHVIVLQKKR